MSGTVWHTGRVTTGRVLASLTAVAAVAGCVAVVLGMSHPGDDPAAANSPAARPLTARAIPVVPVQPAPSSSAAVSPSTSATHRASTHAAPSTSVPSMRAPATRPSSTVATAAAPLARATQTTATAATAAVAKKGVALPLGYRTGNATRVITVTATSRGRTTARLQAWTKAPGGGWLEYGKAVTAHIGAQGMTTAPSESKSATPMGSFTLTQAFGHDTNPGTPLPYLHTTPADWWISQAGPLYNTHQRCSSHCAFRLGDPNEHLYYETPYYDYAVVIDYNTRNAPGGVKQGAGSAFFLHVTDGNPTAGCVAIPQARLITLMRWLSPKTHPRILIGVQ